MKTITTYKTTKKSITGFFNNIKMNTGLLSLLFVLFFAGESFATNYYIAPASSPPSGWNVGSNSNNGLSQTTAYATLAHLFANQNLGSGDIVYIAAGTYTEKGIVVGTDDEGFTIQGAALSSGVPTSIFSGGSVSRWLLINNTNNDNITIDKITIKNYTTTGSSDPDGGAGIKILTGATGLTITNCYFENCYTRVSHRGGAIYATEGISVSNTTFYDNYAAYYGGAVSIELTTSASSFSKCTFSKNTTNAYDGFVIYNGVAQTCTITNCLFYSNGGSITTSNHSARGAGAIGAVTAQAGTISIINSTLYGNTGSGCGGLYTSGGIINAKNCIVNSNTGTTKGDIYRNLGSLNLTNCSYTSASTISSMTSNTGAVTGTPSFTNTGSNDFTLTSSSNCINAGTSSGAPSDDITIATRVGNPDIGCYEYICPEFYNSTYEVGATGKWATLTAAIAALKLCMTDDVILELQNTYDPTGETFPINFTGLPTSASATLTVRPKTGVTETITSSNATGTILLDGADYIYFNGSPASPNTMSNANNLTISNTSTSGYVFKFINDATYNKVEYCNIRGVNTSASNGSIWFSTGAVSGTGNEYNQINYCEIYDGATKPTNAIYSLGDATVNNNITINGNYIYNFFNTSVNSSGVFLSDYNTDWNITSNKFYQTAAVYLSSNVSHRPVYINFTTSAGNNFTVTGNTIGFANSLSTGFYDFTGHTTATTSAVFTGIHLKVGITTASTVSANTIAGITLSDIRGSATASVEGAFNGIAVLGGSVTIGSSGNANVIGSSSTTSSITFYSGAASNRIYGVYLNTTGTVTVAYNTIGGFSTGAASGAAIGYEFAGIYNYTTGTKTISNNTIGGSTTTANSIAVGLSTTTAANLVYGIQNAGAAAINFTSNTIQNLTNYSTNSASVLYGIYNAAGATSTSFTSNTISTLKMMYDNSTSGSATTAITCGIYNNSSVATSVTSNTITTFTIKHGLFKGLHLASSATHTINSNTISDITVSTAGTTSIYGVYNATTGTYNMKSNIISNLVSSSTTAHATEIAGVYFNGVNASSTIEKNKITGFSCTQTGTAVPVQPVIYGIYSSTSGAVLIYNNLFICSNGVNANNCKIFGVYDAGATVSTLYYNTISISGSASSGTDALSSACFAHNNATGAKVTAMKNNIFQNSRTGSTNRHYSYYLNLADNAVNTAGNIDYNYYAAADDNYFGYIGEAKTSTTLKFDTRGYGGINSKYYSSGAGNDSAVITVNSDGSLSSTDLTTVGRGADLRAICTDDIYYVVGERAGASGTANAGKGAKGCYEDVCLLVASNPSASPICFGGTYSPSITATNKANTSVTLTYQLQFSSDNSTFANVLNGTPLNSTYQSASGTSSSVGANLTSSAFSSTVGGDISAGSSYNYRYTVTTSTGCTVNTTSAPLIINPDPIIDAHPTAGIICFGGTYSPEITATGGTSLTYQWQFSSDESTWGNVANGTPANASYLNTTSNNLTQSGNVIAGNNYYYRCVVSDAGSGCGSVTSNPVQLTVNPDNTAGVASSTESPNIDTALTEITHATTGATGIGTATDLPAGVSATWSSNTITISGTPNAAGTFNYSIPLTGGCGTVNATGIITVIGTCSQNEWEGDTDNKWEEPENWSCGIVPTSDHPVVIPNMTNDPIITGAAFAQSLTVNPGAVLTVSSGTLTVTNAVVVEAADGSTPAGSLTFEDDASLVQTNTAEIPSPPNSGKITYKRTTSKLNYNYDFVFWSSPVKEQELGEIWMASGWNETFYSFSTSANNWSLLGATTEMTPGKGYIARARNGQSGLDYSGASTQFLIYSSDNRSGELKGTWTAKFNGVPNNGDIKVPIVKTASSSDNLIGNPYPSALDLYSFYQDNTSVLGANFYFWTHATAMANNRYNDENIDNDYAIYNATIPAGVATSADKNNSNGTPLTGYVAAGQGFFAQAEGSRGFGTTVDATFKNTHRVSGENSTFYRPTQQAQSRNSRRESHKIWLNLTNDKGAFKQQLLAYVQGTTLDYDTNFEAASYEGNANLDFYSNLTNKKLVIQSRPLPFNADDIVPIGFMSTAAETYKVAIDHVDGLFLDNQPIYLEDKLKNVIHDLKQGAYTFTTAAGTFNDRFVVRYTNSALGNEHYDFNNSVQAIANDKVTVYAGVEPIESIEVIDLLGRTLRHYDQINATTYTLGNLSKNDKVLFLKIKLSNQVVVTKKIIF